MSFTARGSGSLRAFAEEMAELRRLLLAHPRGNGQEIPKKATELFHGTATMHEHYILISELPNPSNLETSFLFSSFKIFLG